MESKEFMPAQRQNSYPTIKDISREAGVSKSLVSRALRGEGAVGASTRQRILEVAAALGYRAHAGARAMAGRRTGTFGFAISGLFDPFWGDVVYSVDQQLALRGKNALYMSSLPDGTNEVEIIDRMLEYRVDGIALGVLGHIDAAQLDDYAQIVPLLTLMYDMRSEKYDTLVTDDSEGMSSLVRHLAELGHRDIALLGDADRRNVAARAKGYTEQMEALGLGEHLLYQPSEFLQSDGYDAMTELLGCRSRPPTAVVCMTDGQARGAVLAAMDAGLSVPGDISITGYDDSLHAVSGAPSLTTARLPRVAIGQTAVRLLEERLDGRDVSAVVVLRPQLVVRDSTGPPARR